MKEMKYIEIAPELVRQAQLAAGQLDAAVGLDRAGDVRRAHAAVEARAVHRAG